MFVSIQAAHQQVKPRQRPGDTAPDYAAALSKQLAKRTTAEVRFDSGSRALYATDASNYRQTPIGVVIPRSMEDVIETVAICREFDAPILARGGGTSLAGQCCNIAVVLDFSKYLNRVVSLDPLAKQARVQPGIVLDDLRDAAEVHKLTFGPDPATHTHCTLGGMIGNNSCGVHALMAGKTSENIEELEVLTYDGLRLRVGATSEEDLSWIISEGGRRGEIYQKLRALRDRYAGLIRRRYPNIPRRVSGFNLDQLLPENGFHVARALVGSECTCVLVLEATTKLVYSPPARTLLVLGYPDVFVAADNVPAVLEYGPIGLEGIDAFLVQNMKDKGMHPTSIKLLPEGKGWLLVEFGGESLQESELRARECMEGLRRRGNPPDMRLCQSEAEARMLWTTRESALGATAIVPGQPHLWEGWEDAAVPPDQLGPYLRDFHALYGKYGYKGALYGHFGQGCIHTRANFDLTSEEGIAKVRRFLYEAAELVVRYGGSLSGEHGDGQARAELLPIMYGPELVQAFQEFKAIWDPRNRMNPGKVVHAYKLDENLRLGADYRPPQVETHFRFPDDDGDFTHAAIRCVGVGKCRRHDGGTMCPSYMVTKEEAHSTRGRARLLFEMLQGQVVQEGWKSDAVRESLDLCLSCKGCKSDCPTNVDLATYKSEFLAHYYEDRWRPPHAYAVGLIERWARLASVAPAAANALLQAPVLSRFAKQLLGIAPERQLPPFAPETFKHWFARQQRRNVGAQPVILWADTFSNYYQPAHAIAAVEVLEYFGFYVRVPRAPLCCGRPLYDYGMLDLAKQQLRHILDTLGPAIDAGLPIVGLEPSCVAVFRDELRGLFPDDPRAERLRQQTLTLAEFLGKYADLQKLPQLSRKAVVHGHCHHKAIMKFAPDEWILRHLGLDCHVLDSGCCGMAGGFGFEHSHYEVSQQVGERVLLPAVREAEPDTLIIADGFSCQMQIAQNTDRRALHLAEVLQFALQQQGIGPVHGPLSEQKLPVRALAAGAAGVAIGAALWHRAR